MQQPITADIKFVRELDFNTFDVPFYQRPYRWQISHVETLLSTIRANMKKEEYRIGSIILNPCEESEKLNIVDGQQRLTTLSLLLMCLEENTPHRLTCRYRHMESKQNIYRNYHYIKTWINRPDFDKENFKKFLLERCSFVVIVAKDLSEAFQMFDSQNGRGKELEAYNLLKAYHLRAIDNENTQIDITEEKKDIDRKWEASVLMKTYGSNTSTSLLKYLMNELYRIRQWRKLKKGWPFGKSKIQEFKGIQFNQSQSELPLQNRSFLLYMYFNETINVAHRNVVNDNGQNPFVSIDMDIINGKLFFSYVQTYVAAYNYLFHSEIDEENPISNFRKDFDKYCLNYGGAHRTGDTYIREMYVALIISMYDRFGEEYVGRWYKTLYILAYKKRLESDSVFYNSIADYPTKYFNVIASAIDESGLEPLRNLSIDIIQCKKLGEKEYAIAEFILQSGGGMITVGRNVKINGNEIPAGTTITKEYFDNGKE